jgi:hypothetical protein
MEDRTGGFYGEIQSTLWSRAMSHKIMILLYLNP